MPALLLAASYLLGAIPASYIAGRLARGIDLREHGSGNLGATNVFRVLGPKVAAPVVMFDIFKGWLPTYVFWRWDGQEPWEWMLAYGAMAIVGHVFSVFVRFRGGKGVATSAGVFLALAPYSVLIGLVIWGVVVLVTRIVSLASLAAALALPLVVFGLHGIDAVFVLSLLLAAFVIYAHRSNVRRLMRGEEHRFGRRTREVG